MAQKSAPPKGPKKANTREDRLKAALKANMAKRKAQAKARTGETRVEAETGKTKG